MGGHVNIRDVTSSPCRRRQGIRIEDLDDWKLALAEDRRATPAEVAAVRIDFANWLESLSPRDRRMASVLAAGESTSAVARLFRLSAGRVSQLRRQLYDSWRQFMNEAATA